MNCIFLNYLVPLCPYLTFSTEAPVTTMQVFAYLVHQISLGNRARFPIGLVDDDVEKTFGLTADLLDRIAQHHPVSVNRKQKTCDGFYRGTDPIHVFWRLVDEMDASSHDFIIAHKALKLMFSRCFNPIYVDEDSDADAVDSSLIVCDNDLRVEGIPKRTWESWTSGSHVLKKAPDLAKKN